MPPLNSAVRRRVTSPHLQTIRAAILSGALCLSACTSSSEVSAPQPASALKIDGSSVAAFQSSHARLVEALSPQERLELALAEAMLVAPMNCVTTEPIPGQPGLTRIVGGQANISSCHKQLDGMTYQSIMKQAYASH